MIALVARISRFVGWQASGIISACVELAERLLFGIEDALGWIAECVISAEMAVGDSARAIMLRRLRQTTEWQEWAAEFGEESADRLALVNEMASAALAWMARNMEER